MKKRGLIERLNQGPDICADGFLFEIEKRGYMSSGEIVPTHDFAVFRAAIVFELLIDTVPSASMIFPPPNELTPSIPSQVRPS